MDAETVVRAKYDDAVRKAWDALARYKFWMFGYWAARAVGYGQLLGELGADKPANPFAVLVHGARRKIAADELAAQAA